MAKNKARSERKRNWLTGERYIQHYNKRGKPDGRSKSSTNLFGKRRTENYNARGEMVSITTRRPKLLGGYVTEHHKVDGERLGTSETKDPLFGGRHTDYFDAEGNFAGRSENTKDWFGNKYYENTDSEGRPATNFTVRQDLIANPTASYETAYETLSGDGYSTAERSDGAAQTRSAPWSALLGAAMAFFLVNNWAGFLVGLVVAGGVFLLIWRRSWLKAAYLLVSGISYGIFTATMSFSLLLGLVAALIWPVSWPLLLWNDSRSDNDASPAPAIEIESEPAPASLRPMDPKRGEEGALMRLVVESASNVRSGPVVGDNVVGTAPANTVYDILERSADGGWYKIRLSDGTEGWIGSTRIDLLP